MAFKLRIFESEYEEIKNLVLRYPNIETGGDLFGLWTGNADPVVQLIIGPGEKCRRTSVSFHQDTNYLQNIGTHVNTKFMLCHIGSWHSHHQLSLTQPSAGDRSTVCNNFPPGLERYIMIIANIVSSSSRTGAQSVDIHPYMFTNQGHICQKGTVRKISIPSPFRELGYILRKVNEGAERTRVTAGHGQDTFSRGTSPWRPCRSPSKTGNTAYEGNPQNGYDKNSGKLQWYTSTKGEAKLMKLNQEIKKILEPTSQVEFQRDSVSLDLSLEFRHNGRWWVVEFPSSFDEEPARIKSKSTAHISSKNIVEDIRKFCGCTTCTKVDRDVEAAKGHHHGDRSVSRNRRSPEMSKAATIPWYQTGEGRTTLDNIQKQIASSLAVNEGNVKRKQSSYANKLSLSFRHGSSGWKIDFPRDFPHRPIQIFKRNYYGKKNLISELSEPRDVVETVKKHCKCKTCVPRVGSPRRNASALSHSRHFSAGRRILSAVNPFARKHRVGPTERYEGTPGVRKQWYQSDDGEKKLRKICTNISSMFHGGKEVDISRSASTQDVCVKFDHNHFHWRISFPPNYPKSPPEIGYYDRQGRHHSIKHSKNMEIVQTIRKNCFCQPCQRYSSKNR